MKNRPDRWIAVLLFIFGSVYLLLAFRLPKYPYAIVDSDALPKGLGWLLLFLSILLFINAKQATAEEKEKRNIAVSDIKMLFIVLASTLVYIGILEPIGFLISTIAFLIIMPLVLGYKKKVTTVVTAVIFTGLIYYAFNYWLLISLPQGILSF
ncbi:tripartite tricarboxylate transporter TctB family protein [Siminovitchia fortis]|uniref:tripartite tricarboxylate transporter TctB family protein n=1 Tax=Siminovitchia fortis TaxID=254758 RepID=UPI0011A4A838|nr:tripartite tricarboxylate transporter TctB family protein [Siminovitchia fortis]